MMEEEFKKLESENLWEKHLEMLSVRTRKHSSDAADTITNKTLNRWPDVKPYDRSRVKLNRAEDTNYINANLVTVPKAARQYILTQGPLPNTVGHFWLMIWEQKSIIIVMLNRIVEDINVKCEQYWPSRLGQKLSFPDVKLHVILTDVADFKHYTRRKITLYDDETKNSREITQFHYLAWPDYGQPESPTSFLRLLSAVRKSGLHRMDEPTIVHCSAGIGRSGTFCLIDSILTMVENQGSTEGVDIANTLIEMRDYRMGLIQSPIQLRFSYMSIICGIKILERSNMLRPHISSIKDSQPLDNDTKQKMNGSAPNGKKSRRGSRKPKQHRTNNSASLKMFESRFLVDALNDIDSDEADSLFYDTMKPCPNIKKPRTSGPADFGDDGSYKQTDNTHNGSSSPQTTESFQQTSAASTKAQLLTNAMNSLLTENVISTNNAVSPSLSSTSATQTTDSVLLRRRDRELKNQRILEKTIEIKKRMKEEEHKKEVYAKKMALLRKSAVVGGVTALVVSSLLYIYLHGVTSS